MPLEPYLENGKPNSADSPNETRRKVHGLLYEYLFPDAPVTLASTSKTLVSANTNTPLSVSSSLVRSVKVTAKPTNSGSVFLAFGVIGNSAIEELVPGQTFDLDAPFGTVIDISTIFANAAVAGDVVTVTSAK